MAESKQYCGFQGPQALGGVLDRAPENSKYCSPGADPQKNSSQNNTRLALSREGWLFSFFMVGLGVAAIYSGQSGLMLLFCCLVAIVLLMLGLARKNVQNLNIERRFIEEIYAGRETRIDIIVTNTGTSAVYGIHVFEAFDDKNQIGPMFIRKLAPGETFTARYMCMFPTRGCTQFVGFEVRSRFPLPFFEYRTSCTAQDKAYVFPQPLPGTDLIAFEQIDNPDEIVRIVKADDMIREVVNGRQSGRILWKLSAKRQKWMESVPQRVRECEEKPVIYCVDKNTVGNENFERQLSQITTYVLQKAANGQSGTVWISDQEYPFGSFDKQRLALFEALAVA